LKVLVRGLSVPESDGEHRRVPPNIDASTVVNINKVFAVDQENLFVILRFSTQQFAAGWATVLHPQSCANGCANE